MHSIRGGPVLNQLQQLVFKHHRAGCGGQIASNFECAVIGHRHHAFGHVGTQIGYSASYAAALRFSSKAQGFRVAPAHVGGRRGMHPLPYQKQRAFFFMGIKLRALD